MPSRKRSPTKKNGTCKHCGKRMKGGGLLSWFLGKTAGPTTAVPTTTTATAVPTTTTATADPTTTATAGPTNNNELPQNAVLVTPDTNNGVRIPKKNEPETGGSESKTKPLFGTWGGKSKKSKNSKNSKSKKSKK